ncbi:hypothetical protein OIO90_000502 [Microbotryomycetes sp. JL221]|nr:hypothetical protein OIO90_000502 [Microbotryomycetes sp. JL221]
MPFLIGSSATSAPPTVMVLRSQAPSSSGAPVRLITNGNLSESEDSDDGRPLRTSPASGSDPSTLPSHLADALDFKMTRVTQIIEIVRREAPRSHPLASPTLSTAILGLGHQTSMMMGMSSRDPYGPSPNYLRRAAVRSKPYKAKQPLVVFSVEAVLDVMLPYHSSGGYTNVISRGYLHTLFDYVTHKQSPYCGVFYTHMPRERALQTLKSLNLPVGAPEPEERDSWLGLYSLEDMGPGKNDQHAIKDLDKLWARLYEEHGTSFGVENTVAITHNPQEFSKHPSSFICVPEFKYLATIAPQDDTVLLQLIAALDDLTTETNFPYHIKEYGWDRPETWVHVDKKDSAQQLVRRALMIRAAVAQCAVMRIPIIAFGGNFRWKTAVRSDYDRY